MQALQTIRPQDMLTDPTLPTAVAPASPQPAPPRPAPQQPAPIPTIRPAANSIPTIRGWQPSPQRQAQEAGLQSSLVRQEAPRTPAKGFWGKAGRVLGDIGNVAGTVILGTDKMAAIPGTSEYRAAQHAATGRELTQLETQDQAEQNDEAKRELEGAQTQNLENPPNTIEPTAEGIFGINSRNLTATPVSAPGGQPLHPYVKPGPFSRVTIQDPNDPTKGIEAMQQDGVIYAPGPDGAYTPVTNPRPYAKPSTEPKITKMVGGQPHIYSSTDGGKTYTVDQGIAPPNYGQQILPTKTEKKLGPDGVQHLYGYNQQTQQYDIDEGAAPTGQAAHQIFQGAAIEQLAPQIIDDINAHRDVIGNLGSYYKQWMVGTPVSDPNAAQIMAELMSLAAMQPALHAFRSTNAMEAFEKMVGGLEKNPDSTIATINGMLKTPETFTNLGEGKGRAGAPQTGKVFNSAKWLKANPNGDLAAAKRKAAKEGMPVY